MKTSSIINPRMTMVKSGNYSHQQTMLLPSLLMNFHGISNNSPFSYRNDIAYHQSCKQENATLYKEHHQLLPTDILLGKDKAIFNHSGNKNFRAIIQDNLSKYIAAPSKSYKSKLIRKVHNDITLAGYRFLKRATNLNSNNKLLWQEIEYHEARDKVSHALRDKVRELTKQQKRQRLKQQKEKLIQDQQQQSTSLSGMTVSRNESLNKKIPQADKIQCKKEEDTLERPSKKQKLSSSATSSTLALSQPTKTVSSHNMRTNENIDKLVQRLEEIQAERADDNQSSDEEQSELSKTVKKSLNHAPSMTKLFPSKLPLLSSARKVSVTKEDDTKGNASIKEEDDGILSLISRKRSRIVNEVAPIVSPIPKDDHDYDDIPSKSKRRNSMSSLTSLFSDCPDTIPPSYYNKNIRMPAATRRCSILSSVSFDSHIDDTNNEGETPIGSSSADRRFSMTSITCWEEEDSFSEPEDQDFSSDDEENKGDNYCDENEPLNHKVDSEINLSVLIDDIYQF